MLCAQDIFNSFLLLPMVLLHNFLLPQVLIYLLKHLINSTIPLSFITQRALVFSILQNVLGDQGAPSQRIHGH